MPIFKPINDFVHSLLNVWVESPPRTVLILLVSVVRDDEPCQSDARGVNSHPL